MPPWDNEPKGQMVAAVLSNPGSVPPQSCFSIDTSFPRPSLPDENWILVKVRAAGLNRAELQGRNNDKPGLGEFNIWQKYYRESPPKILGEEFVGTVAEAGSSTNFKDGDLVTGFIYGGGKAYNGAYAQYTLCHKRRLYKLPKTSLSWEVLGSVPMSLWTAYGSIFESGQLQAGQSLLVHGATSSVGIFAVLLAKAKGCTVIASTRQSSKLEKLRATGADYVFLEENLDRELTKAFPTGVDVILELVGPDKLTTVSFRHTARHGTVVCTGVLSKPWSMEGFRPAMIPPTRKLTFYGMTNRGGPDTEDEGLEKVEPALEDAIRKIEDGTWKRDVFLDKVFELTDVGDAHAYMEENKATGKVVLTVPE